MRPRPLRSSLLSAFLSATVATACDGGITQPGETFDDHLQSEAAQFGQAVLPSSGPPRFVDRPNGSAPALEEFETAIGLLDSGQCLLEYGRANGRWLRFVRTVAAESSEPLLPFSVDYRKPGGRVVYRATCNVTLEDRDMAMRAVSWAPRQGPFSAGAGWHSSSAAAEKALPPMDEGAKVTIALSDYDPFEGYYHFDWCYVVMQGDQVVAVLYCGYDSEPCPEGQQLDGGSGECEYLGGGNGNSDPPGPEDCNTSESICPEPELVITCDNNTVIRGQPVSCTAGATEDGILSNLSWSFTYEGISLPNLGDSNPLAGPVAVSGTLQATATINGVDGPPATASQSISVTDREWSQKKWPFDILPLGTGGLPNAPADPADLGVFYATHNSLPNVSGAMTTISSGPNEGIVYLTDMPTLQVTGNVSVNYAALSPPSPFLDKQTGPPYCTATQVSALIPMIEAHEGLNLEPNSHSRAFRDKMWELGGPAMEGTTGTDMGFLTELQARFMGVMDEADAASDLIDQTNPVTVPCDINFD